MTTSWHGYPEVFELGHKALDRLFDGPVLVQEKIDGSQFSFGVFEDGFKCRSKGKDQTLATDDMFVVPRDLAQSLPLTPGWTYRAEYLLRPHHNALAYSRVPLNHLIVFDVNTGHEEYMEYNAVAGEADRIGLEAVPWIFHGEHPTYDQFKEWITRESCLGGVRVEGIVIKNYSQFGKDKKALMGKFVGEQFKETNKAEWKKAHPTQNDVVRKLILELKTEPRWIKAVQHLRESGILEESMRDIPNLLKEVGQDILKEQEDYIRKTLFKWAWPKIQRGVVAGLPEWYKEYLAKRQFDIET